MQKPQSVHCELVADSSLSCCKSATLRAPSATWRAKRAVLGVEKSRFRSRKEPFPNTNMALSWNYKNNIFCIFLYNASIFHLKIVNLQAYQ